MVRVGTKPFVVGDTEREGGTPGMAPGHQSQRLVAAEFCNLA